MCTYWTGNNTRFCIEKERERAPLYLREISEWKVHVFILSSSLKRSLEGRNMKE